MQNFDFTKSLVSFDNFVVYAAFIDTRHTRWLGVPGKLDFRSLCSCSGLSVLVSRAQIASLFSAGCPLYASFWGLRYSQVCEEQLWSVCEVLLAFADDG